MVYTKWGNIFLKYHFEYFYTLNKIIYRKVYENAHFRLPHSKFLH